MDEVAVNKAFFVGFERTSDLMEVIPDGFDGEAEIVGVFVACVNELADRWKMTEREAIDRVAHVIPRE
jgi:hypothetical protein